MADLDLGRYQLGIDHMLAKQDESVSRSGNVVFWALRVQIDIRGWRKVLIPSVIDLLFEHVTFCHSQ